MSRPKKQETKESAGRSNREPHFQSLRGMHDILPKDSETWRVIIESGFHVSELHGFHLIETPILEEAAMFEAAVGATTDVVEKQMYVFKTKGGERVTLRPEGTAPVMRSYLEHHLGYFSSPLKVFYYGPMFRYERPQAGRYRQFHHWGFEIIGDPDPFYDVQIILVCLAFLKNLGIKDFKILINTVGCRICRPNYRKKFVSFFRIKKKNLCADCLRRFDKNPLRILDCKEEACRAAVKKAPIILDCLCQSCNSHFKGVLELIEDNEIDYEPDPYLIRGLDYYSRTVFEIFSAKDPGQALVGGGRYDYLGEILGSRLIPAVGAALGLERLIEYLTSQKISIKTRRKSKVFFIAISEQAKKSSAKLINKLRLSGIQTLENVGKQSLKNQLKAADRAEAPLALIFGQKECFEGTIIIRDMQNGAQETILTDKMVEEVKKRLR